MRKIRFWFSILILIVGLASIAPIVKADFGGHRCECFYPNRPGEYGYIEGDTCVLFNCWIEID